MLKCKLKNDEYEWCDDDDDNGDDDGDDDGDVRVSQRHNATIK